MRSIEEAWEWYANTKFVIEIAARLGGYVRDDLSGSDVLSLDVLTPRINGPKRFDEARRSLSHLDDLAVVVLFSAFEDGVRTHMKDQVQKEIDASREGFIKSGLKEMEGHIKTGQFQRLFNHLKFIDKNLHGEICGGVLRLLNGISPWYV